MWRALVLLAMGTTMAVLSACAASHDSEPGATDQPPPAPENSTPQPDQENLRNIQRDRPR